MNTYLQPYSDEYKQDMISCIAKFFGFHVGLNTSSIIDKIDDEIAEQNLMDWTSGDNHLYMIMSEEGITGFLRIGFRGANVAWIEDIFVKEEFRNRGIATESIRQAEEIIKSKPQYNAVCFDVVPRNIPALKLYYKLGYDTLSMITVRKNLENKDAIGKQNVMGMDYKV